MKTPSKRRYPVGAELIKSGAHFRVWSECQDMEMILNNRDIYVLSRDAEGYFSIFIDGCKANDLYRFRLDLKGEWLPDPASRYQPRGPKGPSSIINPSSFDWQDGRWRGIPSLKGEILYELHIGTFTKEGTWRAATKKLNELAELGITLIEILPVAEFQGRFGWGYDGVNLFAPYHHYGTPEDLKEFVQQVHLLGMGIILDVVFNHLGPGETLSQFSKNYLHESRTTDWGRAINFDGKNSRYVRAFFIANTLYWIEEFHFDGLRFDATQSILDCTSPYILAEISDVVHARIKRRDVILIAENEPQNIQLIKPTRASGFGMDALWNDDFHHSALVRLTGHSEAYYSDYKGSCQEFLSAIKYGFLYQGQYYHWQKQKRGTAALKTAWEKWIIYLQNHDQIANSSRSLRLHFLGDHALLRLMTAVLLLSPQTPLLFQGQEFIASSPFYYFADHDDSINRLVWEGRKLFLSQFPSFTDEEMKNTFIDPSEKNTFLKSKLIWEEKSKEEHRAFYLLHRDLIALRREDPVFVSPLKLDGALITQDIFLLRYFGPKDQDRMILANFSTDYKMVSVAEPLYAPPTNKEWSLLLSTQNPRYGGIGTPPIKKDEWILPGHSALIFKSVNQ